MPTVLPSRSAIAVATQRLSWRETARFLILLARVRWLNRRLAIVHDRSERLGLDAAGLDLLLTLRH